MFGPGRPAMKPEILSVTPLTAEDITNFTPAPASQAGSKVAVLRDSHHMVARLLALGLRPGEVARRAGYSLGRVSTLQSDPAFQELITKYRGTVDESFAETADEYFETVAANRIIAARRLNDMLTDDEKEFTPAQLVAIHADAADRTGYPKRSVAVNVNVDFAARLDKAIAATKKALPSPTFQGSAGGGGLGEDARVPSPAAPPPESKAEILPPLRRRA